MRHKKRTQHVQKRHNIVYNSVKKADKQSTPQVYINNKSEGNKKLHTNKQRPISSPSMHYRPNTHQVLYQK